MTDATSGTEGALAGVRIADFGRVLAAPYATMLLADMGADVIKVEGPAGDDTRTWMPPVDAQGVSTYFLGVNRNKRSIALNLKDDADAAVARRLAGRADIVIENFRPGGLARFGLGYDDVAAAVLDPHLVLPGELVGEVAQACGGLLTAEGLLLLVLEEVLAHGTDGSRWAGCARRTGPGAADAGARAGQRDVAGARAGSSSRWISKPGAR